MLTLILASSLFFCGIDAHQGDDMTDDDFAAYLQAHENFREKYAESAVKGCVRGAVKDGLKGGFQAICIGCATGAAANVVNDIIWEPRRSEDR